MAHPLTPQQLDRLYRAEEQTPTPDSLHSFHESVERFLDRLPPEQAEALLMRLEGMSFPVIALHQEVTIGSAIYRVRKATERLSLLCNGKPLPQALLRTKNPNPGRKRRLVSDDQVREIRRLRQEGHTYRDIAAITGVGESYCYQIARGLACLTDGMAR